MPATFMSRSFAVLLVCAAALAIQGAHARNIIDTATTAGMFSSWINAVREAGLEQTLTQQGPYTVFAPSDEAFANLPADKRDALRNKETLVQVVKLHMAAGKILLKNSQDGADIPTEAGKSLTLRKEGKTYKLGPAQVLEPDVEVDNGVINVLDTVLFP